MWTFTDPTSVSDIPSIPQMLANGARQHPDRCLAKFEGGEEWTWAVALERARASAALLQSKGITAGDRVVLFMGNCPEFLQVWWGCSFIGAVIAPMNVAYRGQILADLISRSKPALIVVDDERRAQLDSIQHGVPLMTPADVRVAAGEPRADYQYDLSDPHAIIYTSGTTGPSKGALCTYPHIFASGSWFIAGAHLTSDDVFLVDMPLFHFSGIAPMLATVSVGGKIAVRKQPSMTTYWQVAKECEATFSLVAGTMVEFLMHQPPSEYDRGHKLRFMLSAPLPKKTETFLERFGVSGFMSAYGCGEVNLVVNQTLDMPIREGSCGKVRSGYDVRLVDERDIPVPVGQIGEAIVRCNTPWLMSIGYLFDPEATAKSWRNGWFHTGDLLRQDVDGYFYFYDRSKDAMRRRGENISSAEVEREVRAYKGVNDVACVPFPSEVAGDDEVKVFVVADKGHSVDFAEMLKFLVENMPHFMVPRYYELIEALPKTATHRIKKHELRAMGNTAATWDSVAAGYRVTRNGLTIDSSRQSAGSVLQ